MSDRDRLSADQLTSEEQAVDWLAARDDALASGQSAPAEAPPFDLAPEATARLQRLDAMMQRLHRVRETVMSQTSSTRADDPSALLAQISEHARSDISSNDDSSAEFELPKKLGRFEIIRELGAGGLGVVVLARDPVLNRLVALKIPRPHALFSRDMRARFLREARAAARLAHPNLLPVFEAGEAGPICYIAAAYCDGPTLADWLSSQSVPPSPNTAARIVWQLAQGMEYAHRQGVIHRDLKPANVMLQMHSAAHVARTAHDPHELPFVPKITDFGLARLEGADMAHTRTGAILGTLSYMAPEQVDARGTTCDHRVDVYGLGAILYELIAGRPPFVGENEADALRQLLQDEPRPLHLLRAIVPRDLEAICFKCLEKDPVKRYASAAALAADLESFLSGRPTQARPPAPAERLLKWSRRRPALAALCAVSAAATMAVVAITALYVGRLKLANEAAEQSRATAESLAENSARQEQIANQYLYASRMRVANQSLEQAEIAEAVQLLDYYKPGSPLASLRGFEWYHLKRRVHSERLTLSGHKGEVYAVAFTPDGRHVVSGGQDGTLRFWDVQTGQPLRTVEAHKSCVNAIVYSRGGEMLATGSCDHLVKLWEAATLEPLATLDGHSNEVHCLAFCPTNPNWLAAAGHEPCVRIWDVAQREIVYAIDLGDGSNGLAWDTTGKTLFVAGGQPLLNPAANSPWRKEIDGIEVQSWNLMAVATTAGGGVCWGRTGMVVHLPTSETRRPFMLSAHTGQVSTVAFAPRGDRFASGGDDRAIRIWDSATDTCIQLLTGHAGRVQSLAFSPSGAELASASHDGTVKLWGSEPADRVVHTFAFSSLGEDARWVDISSDFRYLAFLNTIDEVRIERLADGSLVGTVPLDAPPCQLQFLPGKAVLFGIPLAAARDVCEWDVDRWQAARSVRFPAEPTFRAARWGKYLVTEHRAVTRLTDTQTGQTWLELPKQIQVGQPGGVPAGISLSPDGDSLAIGCDHEENSWVFDSTESPTMRQISNRGTLEDGPVNAISNGGNLTAQQTSNFTLAIHDARASAPPTILRHPERAGPVAFSPDNKTIAVGCGLQSVCLWNVATGQEVARLSVNSGTIQKVRFSDDGRRLACISTADSEPNAAGYTYRDTSRIRTFYNATLLVTVWSGIDSL